MLWGCFSRSGIFSWYGGDPMIPIHGKLNADSYSTFLDYNVLPTLRIFYGLDHCYIQEDNATCHVERSTRDSFNNKRVNRLDWPSWNPAFKSIEHL
ncbi:transposable element tcb1 transposase [Trichonephila clavipes]|nr:transposable element tcb1 transposase [Trichonephila clavipes]